jgi:hypothetical protein
MYGLRELLGNVKKSYVNNMVNINTYFSKNSGLVDVIKANAITYFIVYYGKIFTNVSIKYKKLYQNNVVVKSIIDNSAYYLNYCYSTLIRKKIEPMSSYWISTSVLSKRDKNRYVGDEYTLLESYEFIKNPEQIIDGFTNCETSFNEICDTVDSVVLNSQNYIEGLVKMKIGENYVFRIFDNIAGHFNEFKLPIVPSKAKFLSIEYIHPIMKNGIVIKLDRSVYIVNNQILSPTFIKLYLEHQSELYHFDMDYEIKIMDNDINSFILKSDKSILITETGYLIA